MNTRVYVVVGDLPNGDKILSMSRKNEQIVFGYSKKRERGINFILSWDQKGTLEISGRFILQEENLEEMGDIIDVFTFFSENRHLTIEDAIEFLEALEFRNITNKASVIGFGLKETEQEIELEEENFYDEDDYLEGDYEQDFADAENFTASEIPDQIPKEIYVMLTQEDIMGIKKETDN